MLDQLETLVSQYDRGGLTRRQLLQGLVALGVGAELARPADALGQVPTPAAPVLKARTINHVTIYSSDIPRSKAFYQSLAGLPVRDEGKDYCEFRLSGSFLGLYAVEAGSRPGIDHLCLGVDRFEPKAAFAAIKAAMPEATPTLEPSDQIYVRDPDGVRVQLADVTYKR